MRVATRSTRVPRARSPACRRQRGAPCQLELAVDVLTANLDEAWNRPEVDGSGHPLGAVELVRELLDESTHLNPCLEKAPAGRAASRCATLAGAALAQLYLNGVVGSVATEATALARALDAITDHPAASDDLVRRRNRSAPRAAFLYSMLVAINRGRRRAAGSRASEVTVTATAGDSPFDAEGRERTAAGAWRRSWLMA